ncbi:hypothetical protein C8R44DRAFT_745316 [Mycena epipterygia]|nr:hypothetical protein C8R44DRAFT_745316 [Mycena epipterygia]
MPRISATASFDRGVMEHLNGSGRQNGRDRSYGNPEHHAFLARDPEDQELRAYWTAVVIRLASKAKKEGSFISPVHLKERRKNRLRRKRFWAAGVNDLWAVDQHDKWKYKFGLALHSGIDPFIGRIHWMKIWWTNSNPRLILSYYLDTVQELGIMPLVSQSDPATENFGLANGHTLLRHLRTRTWRALCSIVGCGKRRILVFRWVFIPWLQRELDAYRNRLNNTAKRADRNKVLPHGVPNDMYEHPDNYGVLDFKIKVDPKAIDQVRSLYAPTDHEVFQLVPPDFQTIIAEMYINIGEPPVTRETCWNVYLQLLAGFRALDEAHQVPHDIDVEWGYALTMAGDAHAKDIELMPDLQPLKNSEDVVGPSGSYYMGGVNSGVGLDAEQSAQLDRMMDEDEPNIGEAHSEDEGEIFAWFSDEFAGGSDLDEW